MSSLFTSMLLNGTKNIIWWASGNIIYIVTPHTMYSIAGGVYNWLYPPKTEAQKLLEELREINKHLIELRESGVVMVDKDNENKIVTAEVIIDSEVETLKLGNFLTMDKYCKH